MPQYKAKLDNTAKATTVIVCFVIIWPLFTMWEIFAKTGNWITLLPTVILAIVLGTCVLYSVKGYSIDNSGLTIHRLMGNKFIPLNDIKSIAPINLKEQGFALRTFGSGGFMGYLGWFWYKKLGHVQLFATDRTKTVIIETTAGKPLILSPEDPEIFVKEGERTRKGYNR